MAYEVFHKYTGSFKEITIPWTMTFTLDGRLLLSEPVINHLWYSMSVRLLFDADARKVAVLGTQEYSDDYTLVFADDKKAGLYRGIRENVGNFIAHIGLDFGLKTKIRLLATPMPGEGVYGVEAQLPC